MSDNCIHLEKIEADSLKFQKSENPECTECIKTGSMWVNLRQCQICGHVGCCDSSLNKHASKHYEETGHEVINSVSPGQNWLWCYKDEVLKNI